MISYIIKTPFGDVDTSNQEEAVAALQAAIKDMKTIAAATSENMTITYSVEYKILPRKDK